MYLVPGLGCREMLYCYLVWVIGRCCILPALSCIDMLYMLPGLGCRGVVYVTWFGL